MTSDLQEFVKKTETEEAKKEGFTQFQFAE